MKFVADFHIHSKYSRATSPSTNLDSLDNWAKIKGVKVLGTGDFTHPKWFKEIKEKLKPAEPGLSFSLISLNHFG
jgi:DNA helicase II / ATP-dependent DNA helicase PcrA